METSSKTIVAAVAPPEEFLLSPEFLHHDLDLSKSRYTPRCDADWSPLPRSVCGAYCAHGVQDRKYKVNQDRGVTSYPFAGSRDHALFVNCDGHGPYGHDVADFVVRAVHATLKAHAKLHTDASAAPRRRTCAACSWRKWERSFTTWPIFMLTPK